MMDLAIQHRIERARLRAAIMHAFSTCKLMQEWGEAEDDLLDHATSWLDGLYEDRILEESTPEREEERKEPPVPVPPLEPVKVFDPGQDWRQS